MSDSIRSFAVRYADTINESVSDMLELVKEVPANYSNQNALDILQIQATMVLAYAVLALGEKS